MPSLILVSCFGPPDIDLNVRGLLGRRKTMSAGAVAVDDNDHAGQSGRIRPRWIACVAASVRSCTPSFVRIFLT